MVFIHQLAEHVGIPMVGKSHLTDFAAVPLLLQPLHYPQALQPLPGLYVRQHMHEIVIHIVRSKAPELLPEILFHAVRRLDQIMGQLGGDGYLAADMVALQNLPQSGLAAGIHIRRVIIVHPAPEGSQDFFLRLVHIHLAPRPRKPHAAIAEDGDIVAVFVFPVIHPIPPR